MRAVTSRGPGDVLPLAGALSLCLTMGGGGDPDGLLRLSGFLGLGGEDPARRCLAGVGEALGLGEGWRLPEEPFLVSLGEADLEEASSSSYVLSSTSDLLQYS